ncbi:MAG: hypothetical protein JNL80_12130 [Phycisphaerae bacterium]|jgi:hypothetical protein|nr:hypothetical protein [Phycisphaerae bacterium]
MNTSRRSTSRIISPSALIVATATSLLSAAASAQTEVTINYTLPSADRWNYPFNPTPGIRPTASVFGNDAGSPLFDNRDGQMIVVFNTAADIPAGRAISSYLVLNARVTVEFATDLSLAYDDSTDPWQSFLPKSDRRYIPDTDAGQPMELFGTGFRNGYTPATWVENSPYAPAGSNLLNPGIRNAYGAGFDGAGNLIDISNSVRNEISPDPFAIGFVPGVALGELIPIGSECQFDLATDNPLLTGYLSQGLKDGKLSFSITSLARVVQQGAVFPSFYTKENPLVGKGLASAARLEMTVLLFDCEPGDFDCDGVVGSVDLALLLGAWGTGSPSFDLTGDGEVGAPDLAILLGAWG